MGLGKTSQKYFRIYAVSLLKHTRLIGNHLQVQTHTLHNISILVFNMIANPNFVEILGRIGGL